MLELTSSPWYLAGSLGTGLMTGCLMAHRSKSANEVGGILVIISLLAIITAPYPTNAFWPAYVVLVSAGWVAGVLFLHLLSDALTIRKSRRAQAKLEAQKKETEEEAESLWSAM